MGYIIYIYSRDRGRRIERGKKGVGKKRDRAKKKNGDTYKSEAGGQVDGGARKGCEYKNERGNEAGLEKKKSETEHGEQRTD